MYLAIRTIFAIGVIVSVCTAPAFAKTPVEVYEQAAKSTVVVNNLDVKGLVQSMGSGVILPGRDVVTNCHVVKGAHKLKVRIGQHEYPATLRHSDWDRDVCSLGVTGLTAPAVVMGSSKTLKVGAKVYAIGAPQGLELTLSDGIVSNLREIEGGQYIQTTAAISPGSSGGGLFDDNGALVGLTTFHLAEGQSLNFAVPVEWVKELPKRSIKTATSTQSVTKWLNKAMELEADKDWPALLEHGRRWAKAQPGSGAAWFVLGLAYDKAGQTDKAIEAFQHALSINPKNADAWRNLGITYIDVSHPVEAIEAIQHGLRIQPEDANAWAGLGLAYDKAGQFTKSIEAYQQVMRINPTYTGIWLLLGSAYDAAGQFNNAIGAYKHALSVDPANSELLNNLLGNAYFEVGLFTDAIEALKQVLFINPDNAEVWNNLGVAYFKANQYTNAVSAYQQVLRINPEKSEAWVRLGLAYSLSGERGKVLEVYKRLKTLDPASAEHFFKTFVLP